MQFRVIYPDRPVAMFQGKEVVVSSDNEKFSVEISQLKPKEKPHKIDPRAVIVSNIGIEYTPRLHVEKMSKDLQEWFKTNKDWPLMLFLR